MLNKMKVSLLTMLCLGHVALFAEQAPAKKTTFEIKSFPEEDLSVAKFRTDDHWVKRYKQISHQIKLKRTADVVFIGDSITEGLLYSKSWKAWSKDKKIINAGISSDKVENILWRLQHRNNLRRLKPKVAVVLAGVNNLAQPIQRISQGVDHIVTTVRTQSPKTEILLLAVFPIKEERNHKYRKKVLQLNKLLSTNLAQRSKVTFLDIGSQFLTEEGKLSTEIMGDFIHPTEKGKNVWLEAVKPTLSKLSQATNNNRKT